MEKLGKLSCAGVWSREEGFWRTLDRKAMTYFSLPVFKFELINSVLMGGLQTGLGVGLDFFAWVEGTSKGLWLLCSKYFLA